MQHLDPVFPIIMKILLITIGVSIVVRRIRQPTPIAYIIAGVLLGPSMMGSYEDVSIIGRLGSFGIIFLLFFVGQEISVKQITSNWKLAVLGTFAQIVVSVFVIYIIGLFLDWNWQRALLVGFAISLSSTAMAINLLEEKKQLDSLIGRDIVTFLVSQDLAIVPMLIILGLIVPADDPSARIRPLWQLAGGGILVSVVLLARSKLRFFNTIMEFTKGDKELQFFVPIFFCLLFSFITGYFEISTALGAFVAGLVIPSIGHKDWFHHSIEPFKVLFVGLFFISIGMLVDLDFLYRNLGTVTWVAMASFAINTAINSVMFRYFGRSWSESIFAGALLGQIGEFGFVLASIGFQSSIIDEYAYKLIMVVTAITLFLTPIWTFCLQKSLAIFSKKSL